MRKFFTTLKSVVAATIIASMTFAASCSYDDSAITERVNQVEKDLAALADRVAALEENLQQEVPTLEELLDGKAVIVNVTTDENGNTILELSNGKTITVLGPCGYEPCDHECQPCDCDNLLYREVDGVLEVSADGVNWVAINGVTAEQVVANVVINEDGTATITLADGQEFTVVKAELIECDATRSQVYVLPDATKNINFTINDAVSDVNVMNQPLGWKASIELAPASEDELDGGMGVLAAGGTEFILKVTGPTQDFVNAGYAEKEGYVSVHFNSANGGCKVAKVLVNLAEITLDVDAVGNITLTSSVATEQTGYWGDVFTDFADWYIGVVPADVYAQYGDKSFTDNWDDWEWAYSVNVNHTKRTSGFSNVVDLQYYEEGVCEKETYTFTVDQLASMFYPSYTFEYGQEYIIFASLEGELVSYQEHPVLKGAVMDTYKSVLVEASYVADSATWNNATFNFSLAGYQYYCIGWVPTTTVLEYIAYGQVANVEEFVPFYINGNGLFSAGAIISGDFMNTPIALTDLAAASMTGYAPALSAGTEYVFYIYAFNAATEMELYTHVVDPANVFIFDNFTTAELKAGEFDPAAEFEVVQHEEKQITVNVAFSEDVVTVAYNWFETPFMDPEEAAAAILADEYYTSFVTFDEYTTFVEAYKYGYYGLPNPIYLGMLAINAAGEYVYVEQEFKYEEPEPTAVAATSAYAQDVFFITGYTEGEVQVDFTLENGETASVRFRTGTGEEHTDDWYYYANMWLNIGEWYDWNNSTNGVWYTNGYLNGSDASIKGAVKVDYNENGYVIEFQIGGYLVTYTGEIENLYAPSNYEGGETPATGFVPVRAELDLYFDGYEFNGNDSEYAFWLYDAEENCLEVVYHYCQNNDWSDEWAVKFTKADGTVVEGYTSLQTQQPNDWNCEAGEKYYAVIATLSDGTEIDVQTQIPTTEVNKLGEGASSGDEPVEPTAMVFTTANVRASSGFGDFYIDFYTEAGDLLILNFYNCQDAAKNFLPAGTYYSGSFSGSVYLGGYSSYTAFGGSVDNIDSLGSVVVSEVDAKYKFEINDVRLVSGAQFSGVFEGTIEGMILPSEWVEPEAPDLGEATEWTIAYHTTSYGGKQGYSDHEIYFWVDASTYAIVDFTSVDSEGRVNAGTYDFANGLNSFYCKSPMGGMVSCTAVVTDGDDANTKTFDVTFVDAANQPYHFTYTAKIYPVE